MMLSRSFIIAAFLTSSFLVPSAAVADQYALAAMKTNVVMLEHPSANGAVGNFACLDNILLEPMLRFYGAVEQLKKDFPGAIVFGDPYFCIDQNKVPQDRLDALIPLLKRLPSRIAERLAERQAEREKLIVEANRKGEVTNEDAAKNETRPLAVSHETVRPPFPSHKVSDKTGLPDDKCLHVTAKNVAYFTGGSIVVMGAIAMLPPEYSKWEEFNELRSDPDMLLERSVSNFKRAFTSPPVWDTDPWPTNYIGHPVTGMVTFLMERNHGSSFWKSFAFSTGASIAWEYAIESWVEQPSAQDLLFTSTIGSLLGEGNHRLTQWMRKDGFNKWEKVVVTILNPVYVVQHGYR